MKTKIIKNNGWGKKEKQRKYFAVNGRRKDDEKSMKECTEGEERGSRKGIWVWKEREEGNGGSG